MDWGVQIWVTYIKIILHLKWWLWFYDSKDNGYKLLYCLNGLHVSIELEHWECDCGEQQPENEFLTNIYWTGWIYVEIYVRCIYKYL